jgi:hypothetical protein
MEQTMKPSVVAILLTVAFALQTHAQPAQPQSVSATVAPCAKVVFPGQSWKQDRRLEKAGWSQTRLLAAQQYAGSLHDQSMMTIECGRLIDAWGDTGRKITTFSVRKSLISALFGIYAAEGKIDLNETLEHAGIDDAPSPLTKEERQARVIDLLRARSGIYHAASFETDFQRKIRPVRGSHVPGSFWFYNNWDFNALGTLFEKKTGLKIGEAFYRRIAKPIGMQDFKPEDVYYVGDESVSEHPAYMFRMTTRDMARFGLLYLNHGRWKKRQVVPRQWVEKSSHTSEMVRFGKMPVGGYENLWWVEYGGVHLGEATVPGMFSAQGAGGHYIVDVPSRGLVFVNQYENEPAAHDSKSVLLAAQDKHAIFDDQASHLMKMILDSQTDSTVN